MNIDYKSNKIRKQLSNATEIKKAFGTNAKRVAQRLDDIIDSPNLEVLLQIPAANCHPLTGDRNGQWAVDISASHRMIFEINHDPVPEKDDGSIDTILVTDILVVETNTNYH
jgi:plasmid maintenance system killer protein